MTNRFKPHPAAEIFPMMLEPELNELAADIRQRGQLQPIIVTGDNLVLDGRNRLEACQRAEVEPYVLVWDGDGDPFASPTAYVLSANLRRRHLTESQRGLVGAEAEPLFAEEAKARQKAALKRGDALPPAPSAPRGAHGEAAESKKGKSAKQAAKAAGASTRTVERTKAVLKKRPELREQIRAAKLTIGKAEKAIKKEEAIKNVLEYRPPLGTYAVIVADPSWKFDDALDGSDQARGGVGYPPQTEEEICAMQVGKNQAAPDCALWLWVTNTHLINGAAARVLEAWGFTGKALYTWRKVDKQGNDRLGAGHYGRNVTEHVILAVRGKPVVDGAGQANIFDAARTSRHSEKPARFFEIAEKVTPCPPEARIELFAIEERKGWVVSGSEQQAKARATRHDAHEPKPRVERAAFSELTWFHARLPLPCVARGEGKTGRYEVYRRRGGFRWSLTHEDGESVKSWPESPTFASLEEAKADAEAMEVTRRAGRPQVPAMAEPPKAKKRRKLQIVDVSGDAA